MLVDVAVAGGEVLGDGHGHAGTVGEGTHRLDQSLAKGLLSHQQGPFVVLKRPGKDLAGTGRSLVDQHHQGLVGDGVAIGPLDVLNAVAGFGGDDHAFIEPLPRNFDTGNQ